MRSETKNDIAILKLSTPIIYNELIGAVCLPDANTQYYLGDVFVTLGWGKTYYESGMYYSFQ